MRRRADHLRRRQAALGTVVGEQAGDQVVARLHSVAAHELGHVLRELLTRHVRLPRPRRIVSSAVRAHVGDQSLGSEAFHFRRQDGVAEDFRPAQNRELLTKLAEQTGGRYWTLDELAALPEEIRFSEAGVTAREIMDLWDMPLFFLLLLGLRAAEWLLRRRWGVV